MNQSNNRGVTFIAPTTRNRESNLPGHGASPSVSVCLLRSAFLSHIARNYKRGAITPTVHANWLFSMWQVLAERSITRVVLSSKTARVIAKAVRAATHFSG